ncbi:Major Facilitator Superfamily (MFS), partial [Diplonema papillatum]
SRLEFFLKQATYTFAALSVGPVIAVICFLVLGNTWTLKNLSIVLLLGLAIRIPCGLLCFQFSDDFALAKESADVRQVQIHNAMSTNSAEPADAQERELRRLSARSKHYGKVPYVLYSASVIAMIGSGMTVKFFPIFFQTAATDGGLELSPVVVVLICLGRRLACMLGSRTLLKFSRIVGRAQVELLAWYVGIAGATGIVVMGYTGHYTTRLPDRLGILVLYLLRVGTLQATGPIRSSIMMDFVPKNKRARWASLQQINQVGWSGSAALGGLLIETHSYRFVFLITAVVHFASTLPKLSLLCIIPRHEVSMISKQPAPAEPQQIAGPAEDSDEDNERTALVINA